jgi:hypothetical protein
VRGTYAKTAQFAGGLPPSSVDGIVRLAKAFPELPTKQLEVMNWAAGKAKAKAKKSSATVHGPLRRQVFIQVHPPLVNPNPADLLDNVRMQLSLHHSKLVVESAVVTQQGFAITTTSVASDEELQHFRGATRLTYPSVTQCNAALPTSTSYLKLADVPFMLNDRAISPEAVLSQIAKAGLSDHVVLQSPPRVVRTSPKSDTCTVYLNVADSVNGARAQGPRRTYCPIRTVGFHIQGG